MESVWWIFNETFKKDQVYRGCKIMPYSTGCNTALSNFEATQEYLDVIDPAQTVNFPLVEDENTLLVAWTTTPWTLPSNFAICVNPDMDYVKVKDFKRNKNIIIMESRLCELYTVEIKEDTDNAPKKENKKKSKGKNKGKKDDNVVEIITTEKKENKKDGDEPEFEILERFKGRELEGKEYVALFEYYSGRREAGCYKVICDNFVTSESGTGLVHCAPAYGEDDYRVCCKYKMIPPNDPGISIDDNGCFLDFISDFKGLYIKDADKLIIKYLKNKERVVKNSQCKHSYPFCYRSHKPLIYRAVTTWFIKVPEIKDDLLNVCDQPYWVPDWAKEKRFKGFLTDVREWCFSRTRCWGNPIPLWVSDDGEEVVCVGSLQELKELTGKDNFTDIHREFIDDLTIESKLGKGKLRRIEEVFDCWFESGSMPFASVGYPNHISEEDFSKKFPADFIGEGIDQT